MNPPSLSRRLMIIDEMASPTPGMRRRRAVSAVLRSTVVGEVNFLRVCDSWLGVGSEELGVMGRGVDSTFSP